MEVSEVIEELKKFKQDAEVEVMVGWSCKGVRCVSGDNEEGVYLELEEA